MKNNFLMPAMVLCIGMLALVTGVTSCGAKGSNGSEEDPSTVCPPAETKAKVVKEPVVIHDTLGLKIYYPQFGKIDLACGDRPSKDDEKVLMVVAAAYTRKLLNNFSHDNIIGRHVSGGKYYEGAISPRCMGTFVWDGDSARFYYEDEGKALQALGAQGKGCGFEQEMMIHEGKRVRHQRPDSNREQFRALCLIDGRLAVADATKTMEFGDFIDDLQKAGATEALYMDMGPGWNWSWYRGADGKPRYIHSLALKFSTNWLTFYS